MALFDRRLLAYFDDGQGAAGSVTLLDRIADYQLDLADIERELAKYQVLLGNRQVPIRHRDRDGWIAKTKTRKTIAERYGRVAQEKREKEREDSYDHGDESQSKGRRRSSVAGASRTSRRVSYDPNIRSSKRGSQIGGRNSTKRASTTERMRVVWVQIDTVNDPPGPKGQHYFVRANWQGMPGKGEETEERAPLTQDDGQDKVFVRQQLNLKGLSSTDSVTCSLYSKQDGRETFLGEISLDSSDSFNHEVQMHQLRDRNGSQLRSSREDSKGRVCPTILRVRLSNPEAQSKKEANRAQERAHTGARSSPRMSTFPVPMAEPGREPARGSTEHRPSIAPKKEQRASIAAAPSKPAEEAAPRKSLVTQDAAAARASTSRGSAEAGHRDSAASEKTDRGAEDRRPSVKQEPVAVAAPVVAAAMDSPDLSLAASPSRASADSPRGSPGLSETPMTPGFNDKLEDAVDEFEEENGEESDRTYDEEEEEEEGEEEEGEED